MNSNKEKITVQTTVQADINKVWEFWTKPEHIVKWNFASDDWCCASAINNLRPSEEFNWRMESKDGKIGFDFPGIYDEIIDKESISYKMTDGRAVNIEFTQYGNRVNVNETFEAEGSMQRSGWQAILGNFKKYVESEG